MATSLGVQKLSWLIMLKRFEEAYELAKYIDQKVTSLAMTHQMLVKLEKLYAMIMTDQDAEEIKNLFGKYKKNFQTLKRIPSTQRTLYAYYKRVEPNVTEADKAKELFEKIAKKYPYPSEIEVERELLQLVEKL